MPDQTSTASQMASSTAWNVENRSPIPFSYQSISRTPFSVESYHGKGAPARGIGGKCALEPPLTGGFAELYEEALFGTSRHQAGNSIVRSPIGTTSPTFGVRSFQSAR